MKLFHSFPRPRRSDVLKDGTARQEYVEELDKNARAVLQSILEFGLLCTPEPLKIFSDRNTQNKKKKLLLARDEPEHIHTQTRFCMTLCEEAELFESKIRGLAPGPAGPVAARQTKLSHADLFGPYSISFDPIQSRRLGIIPTNYYTPTDLFGGQISVRSETTPGLNLQMIQRLKELRDVGILLAMIERSQSAQDGPLADGAVLKALGFELPFEAEIVRKIDRLSQVERRRVYDLFDIDRESGVGLVGFVEMMLSAFQETDSTFDKDDVLAFYQQREWRLVHHMRDRMVWYCLGSQPEWRDGNARSRPRQIAQLRRALSSGEPRSEEYYQHCWLLEQVDCEPMANFIVSIVAPAHALAGVRDLCDRFDCPADVVAAEDYGYSPRIMN